MTADENLLELSKQDFAQWLADWRAQEDYKAPDEMMLTSLRKAVNAAGINLNDDAQVLGFWLGLQFCGHLSHKEDHGFYNYTFNALAYMPEIQRMFFNQLEVDLENLPEPSPPQEPGVFLKELLAHLGITVEDLPDGVLVLGGSVADLLNTDPEDAA